MRFFPCLFRRKQADPIEALYAKHDAQRAKSPVRPIPRLVSNPYAGAPAPTPARPVSKHPALGMGYGANARRTETSRDEGFDGAGFMLGYATGMPISPGQGVSMGSLVGAAMHQSSQPADHAASAPASDPTPSSSCDTSSSSSYDSSSSSSFSSDSSGGGCDGSSF